MAQITNWNAEIPLMGKLGSSTKKPIMQTYDIQVDDDEKRLDDELADIRESIGRGFIASARAYVRPATEQEKETAGVTSDFDTMHVVEVYYEQGIVKAKCFNNNYAIDNYSTNRRFTILSKTGELYSSYELTLENENGITGTVTLSADNNYTYSNSSAGGSITVDDELSNTSENPVQNKVVCNELIKLNDRINDLPGGGMITAAWVHIVSDPSHVGLSSAPDKYMCIDIRWNSIPAKLYCNDVDVKEAYPDSVYGANGFRIPFSDTTVSGTYQITVENEDGVTHTVILSADNNYTYTGCFGALDIELSDSSPIPAPNKLVTEAFNKYNPRMVVPYYPTDEQRAAREMRGWYRIAEVKKSGYFSNLFHLRVSVARSSRVSDVIFTAERIGYNSAPSIGVLSFASQRGKYDAIDNLRLVYLHDNKEAKAYLEVHIDQQADPADAWDGTGESTHYDFTVETAFSKDSEWTLLTPTLVDDEVAEGWDTYNKSPLTSAWSKVTDVASQNYVDEKINEVKAMFPTITIPINDILGVTDNRSIVKYAIKYDFDVSFGDQTYTTTIPTNTGIPNELWNDMVLKVSLVVDSYEFEFNRSRITCNCEKIINTGDDYYIDVGISGISCSRALVTHYLNEDGEINGYAVALYVSISVFRDDEEGSVWDETHTLVFDYDTDTIDGTVVLYKTEETESLGTSTYDMRTQSIDRQLAAALEEAKARREAAKSSNQNEATEPTET